jgi:putative PIN family toxin of toxin-antitoxin system
MVSYKASKYCFIDAIFMILIDTNVFVGACMDAGASAALVELCLRGQVQPVMGASLLAEYEDVLGREALFADCRLNVSQREELLDIFLSVCHWRHTYFSWRPNLRDEGDNHIVELAVAAAVSHVVTWNVRDFAAMELRFPALKFLSPPQFLKELS